MFRDNIVLGTSFGLSGTHIHNGDNIVLGTSFGLSDPYNIMYAPFCVRVFCLRDMHRVWIVRRAAPKTYFRRPNFE